MGPIQAWETLSLVRHVRLGAVPTRIVKLPFFWLVISQGFTLNSYSSLERVNLFYQSSELANESSLKLSFKKVNSREV